METISEIVLTADAGLEERRLNHVGCGTPDDSRTSDVDARKFMTYVIRFRLQGYTLTGRQTTT